jgi:hypothetical protein
VKGNANTSAKGTRLRGRQYAAPPRPAILRSDHRTRLADKANAWGTGGVMAKDDEVLLDETGQLHYLKLIDHESDGAIAGIRQCYGTPKGNARETGQDAELRQEDAERELTELDDEDAQDETIEDRLKHRRGLKPLGYALLLVLLYLITLAYDVAAASGLPIAPGMQTLAALTIGALIMVAAHWAAHKEQDVEDAREHQHDDPEGLRQALIQYRAVLFGAIALIIGIGLWRYFTFEAEAKATGGIFAGGAAANIAFTLLALVAFFAAYLAGQAYLKLYPLRKIRAKRERTRERRKFQQNIIDNAERIKTQALLTLEFLEQDEAGVVQQLEAWRDARKDKFMHDVRVREHKRRQKQLKNSRELASDAANLPAIATVDPRFNGIDLNGLADDVKTRANHG